MSRGDVMRKLGKFTGKVYGKDYDFSKCPECCVCISEQQSEDEQFIKERHTKDLMDCLTCMSCPAALQGSYL